MNLTGVFVKGNEPAVGAGNRTLDEDQFLLGEDFNDLKSLGSDFLVTVLAVHFLTFKNAARGGTLPDTPGSSMPAVSMGRRLTTKSVAFHDPGKTFAF